MEVKSSVSDIDQVTKQIKVSIPADTVSREIESAITNVASTTKVKGFRSGKAPRHVVERMHGTRIRLEVANRLISSSLYNVISQNSINIVGEPEIDVASIEPGKEIEYTANVSIFPTPEIVGYEDIAVKVPKREVVPAEVDQVIKRLQESKATLRKNEFRNVAAVGDVIDASLHVEVEGEKPSRPEPLVVGLGENRLPQELEAGIVGMEVGATKEIVATLPSDHPNKELQGKKATYRVTLNSLSEKILPEANDEFAKSLTELSVQTLLELRVKIGQQLEEEHKNATKGDVQMAVLEHLVSQNQFQVPQIIIDDEIKSMLVRSGLVDANIFQSGKIKIDEFREKLGETALKRVRGAIIVDQLARKLKIQASEEEISERIRAIAKQNEISEDDVRKYFRHEDRESAFIMELSRSKLLDHLCAQAKVSFEEKSATDDKKST